MVSVCVLVCLCVDESLTVKPSSFNIARSVPMVPLYMGPEYPWWLRGSDIE